MTVTEMRRYLSEMRTLIDVQTEDAPFTLMANLSNGQLVSDFAVAVACGIHEKRSKVKKKETAPSRELPE